MKIKTPTQKEKIKMYEKFLHDIQMYSVCGRDDLINVLLNNACSWSYAHRCGDCYSEKETNQVVNANFWQLTTVPDILK